MFLLVFRALTFAHTGISHFFRLRQPSGGSPGGLCGRLARGTQHAPQAYRPGMYLIVIFYRGRRALLYSVPWPILTALERNACLQTRTEKEPSAGNLRAFSSYPMKIPGRQDFAQAPLKTRNQRGKKVKGTELMMPVLVTNALMTPMLLAITHACP